MPHRLYDWRVQVKAAEREYQAVRLALDWLEGATSEEIHELSEYRGWDDLAVAEVYAAGRNLDATYLIRMYSVFERAVVAFWRQIPGNADRQVNGDVLLDEVGEAQLMGEGVIESAQTVRILRNNLVHRRFEEHAGAMPVNLASRHLLTFLNRLPAMWS